MSEPQVPKDYRDSIDWEEIYQSDLHKTLKRRRMLFVVPAIILTSLAFALLWTIQNYIPELANMQVIGYVNFAFLFTMILFPVIWLAGFLYTKYASAVLEPIEQKINDRYGMTEGNNG